jgi:polyvinyl alcohol dehydrogenase (cytochrome)
VHNGVVYTGVASTAEGATLFGAFPIPASARGSAVAVNATTGAIMWKTYMVPAGYTGGGVWGSNPVVDVARNSVFVSTGNNYTHAQNSAPSSNPSKTYGQCIADGGNAATCASPDNHVDSVVALNLATGAVKWATKLVTWNQSAYGVADGSDDWNVDCLWPILNLPNPPFPPGPGPQCPSAAGPDYDFGSTPNLITYKTGNSSKTILGAGQKSGIYYALDPDTGAVLWQTQVGPGSALGGMEWGSASDGKRIYVQIANLYGIHHGGGNAGSWAALDPATGQILWQVADPNGAIALGPLAVADGVVYVPSMAGAATAPTMLALNAANGDTLWSFAAGSSVNAGATIVDGVVYWGSGYTHLNFPGQTGNNKFYAFSKHGK